jgi:hypothetical protein
VKALGRLGATQVKGFVACDNRAMNTMVRRMGFQVAGTISLHDHRPSYVYVIRTDTGGSDGRRDGRPDQAPTGFVRNEGG